MEGHGGRERREMMMRERKIIIAKKGKGRWRGDEKDGKVQDRIEGGRARIGREIGTLYVGVNERSPQMGRYNSEYSEGRIKIRSTIKTTPPEKTNRSNGVEKKVYKCLNNKWADRIRG